MAYLAAERLGWGEDFFWAAYRARWEEGRNICDAATLVGIARALDLDEALLTGAVADPEIRANLARASAHMQSRSGTEKAAALLDRLVGAEAKP